MNLVSLLTFSQLELIVKEKNILCDEYTLYRLVQAWAEEGSSEVGKDKCGIRTGDTATAAVISGSRDNQVITTKEGNNKDRNESQLSSSAILHDGGPSRIEQAQQLIQHIDLSLISPSKLTSIMNNDTQSSLMTTTQLLQAFQIQALKAEQDGTATFSKLRYPGVWETSQTTTFVATSADHSVEKLKCKSLMQGIFRWSILVEELCNATWLGVAATAQHELQVDSFLGHQNGGWVVSGENGYTYHAPEGEDDSELRFQKGSKVTFILDLTSLGVLSAYVDDHAPPIELFTGMCLEFEGGRKMASFVPAVSLKSPGRVKFLGFA